MVQVDQGVQRAASKTVYVRNVGDGNPTKQGCPVPCCNAARAALRWSAHPIIVQNQGGDTCQQEMAEDQWDWAP